MQQRRAFAALYRRGVLATLPALLVSSAASVLFNWPWALEPVTERVMMLTPVDLSQQLLLHLGTYARPLALLGGMAIMFVIGGAASALAGDLSSAGRAGGRLPRPCLALCFLTLTTGILFRPLAAMPWLILVAVYVAALVWSSEDTAGEIGHWRAGLAVNGHGTDATMKPHGLAARERDESVRCQSLHQDDRGAGAYFQRNGLGARADWLTIDGRVPAMTVHGQGTSPAVAPDGAADRSRRSGRRAFLADSARILATAAVIVALLLFEPWYRGIVGRRDGARFFAFPAPRPRRPGFNLEGLTPEVTPPGQFYELSKNLVDPDLSAEGWTLRVAGLVARPLALTFSELLALPARSLWVTQECVSNPVGGPLISCGLFTGVPLCRLLLRAGPLTGASRVVMRAPDGHADSIPLSLAMQPDVLVAYGLDGAYLAQAHGYPARILVPGSYGFKSVKWVTQLELVDHQFKGTWQELGWTERAVVQTTARIDLARRAGTSLVVAGVAFAGARGVRAVQVRADRDPWVTARLHTPPLSPLTWVQWRIALPLHARAPATLALEARAIDGSGAPQDVRRSDIYPAGATGYHRVTVTV